MYKYYHRKLPKLFNEYFIKNNTYHHHETRNNESYRVPFYRSRIGSRFIKKTGIETWNQVLVYADPSVTLKIFKYMVRLRTMNTY